MSCPPCCPLPLLHRVREAFLQTAWVGLLPAAAWTGQHWVQPLLPLWPPPAMSLAEAWPGKARILFPPTRPSAGLMFICLPGLAGGFRPHPRQVLPELPWDSGSTLCLPPSVGPWLYSVSPACPRHTPEERAETLSSPSPNPLPLVQSPAQTSLSMC